jgi:peptidoglycan hydrolase-like amidase
MMRALGVPSEGGLKWTEMVVVQKRGSVFQAEHAAESNNGACANGFTGSPAAGWPCMSDSTCSGSSYTGHGRGMCQWGTQRWASSHGKSWVWIVNHYNNNNGNPSGARSAYLGNH